MREWVERLSLFLSNHIRSISELLIFICERRYHWAELYCLTCYWFDFDHNNWYQSPSWFSNLQKSARNQFLIAPWCSSLRDEAPAPDRVGNGVQMCPHRPHPFGTWDLVSATCATRYGGRKPVFLVLPRACMTFHTLPRAKGADTCSHAQYKCHTGALLSSHRPVNATSLPRCQHVIAMSA